MQCVTITPDAGSCSSIQREVAFSNLCHSSLCLLIFSFVLTFAITLITFHNPDQIWGNLIWVIARVRREWVWIEGREGPSCWTRECATRLQEVHNNTTYMHMWNRPYQSTRYRPYHTISRTHMHINERYHTVCDTQQQHEAHKALHNIYVWEMPHNAIVYMRQGTAGDRAQPIQQPHNINALQTHIKACQTAVRETKHCSLCQKVKMHTLPPFCILYHTTGLKGPPYKQNVPDDLSS